MIEKAVTDAEVAQSARAAALKLLARREHSRAELRHKLEIKGWPPPVIECVLSSLEEERYLSDARFAEAYVRGRSERGYGPMRIRAELRERGVGDEVIDQCLRPYRDAWVNQLSRLHARRCKYAATLAERARQARFLHARGYTAEQIRAALRDKA